VSDEPDPTPTPARTCCPMRRKVLVGVISVLPEAQCGVGDAELADFLRFDLQTPSGKPVIAFRFCPWCGQPRGPEDEVRIVELGDPTGDGPPGDGPPGDGPPGDGPPGDWDDEGGGS
jgi:hypothetical protein